MGAKSIIKLITHPAPWESWQARIDEAIITSQPYVELPYWFENTETGQLYYNIYECIGYPTEVQEKDKDQPGYCAIVAVVRPNASIEHFNPIDAKFQLLAEAESKDINTLYSQAISLREKYGFGCQRDLLKVSYGDPDRFLTTLALRNERILHDSGQAFLITPPVDFYDIKVFDSYIRSLKACLLPKETRFYFGGNDILKTNLREFQQDCPSVMAVGGLVHSLLTVCTWMGSPSNNIFSVSA